MRNLLKFCLLSRPVARRGRDVKGVRGSKEEGKGGREGKYEGER